MDTITLITPDHPTAPTIPLRVGDVLWAILVPILASDKARTKPCPPDETIAPSSTV